MQQTDESRRLGLKQGRKGRSKAQGWRLTGRSSRKMNRKRKLEVHRDGWRRIGRRRRSQVGRKAEPESQSAAQAAVAGSWAGGSSPAKVGDESEGLPKVGRQRKLEVGRRASRRLVGGASRGQTGWLAVGSDADIQSEVELEGDAGRLADDASRQSIGKRG